MVNFRDLAKSAAKFTASGQAAQPAYVANAAAAGQTWQDHTIASEPNYVTGVQQAAARGAFGKGVSKAGAAKYVKQINAVGGPRFSDGISKAGPAWQTNFGAIATQVANTTLPPRGIRGSQANKDRARAMGEAFRAAKVGAVAA
jgi:hypothetical protein